MNAAMFLQPITAKHLSILENEWGVKGEDDGVEAHNKALSKGWFEVFRPIEVRSYPHICAVIFS